MSESPQGRVADSYDVPTLPELVAVPPAGQASEGLVRFMPNLGIATRTLRTRPARLGSSGTHQTATGSERRRCLLKLGSVRPGDTGGAPSSTGRIASVVFLEKSHSGERIRLYLLPAGLRSTLYPVSLALWPMACETLFDILTLAALRQYASCGGAIIYDSDRYARDCAAMGETAISRIIQA